MITKTTAPVRAINSPTEKRKKIVGVWLSTEDFIYSVYCRQGYYSALSFIIRARLANNQETGENLLDEIITNKEN